MAVELMSMVSSWWNKVSSIAITRQESTLLSIVYKMVKTPEETLSGEEPYWSKIRVFNRSPDGLLCSELANPKIRIKD